MLMPRPLPPALPALLLAVLSLARAEAAEPLRYNRDIRPILSENCFSCHGPDANHRKAGLRLDVREETLKAVESGEIAIVPGEIGKSALWERMNSTDADDVMPPPKAHKTVTVAQKEKLRLWIEQGAKYEPHWAYAPLAPLPMALPVVQRGDWARNDLDRFILARLESEGLAPSAAATKETLIRRVSLDLTGLPPTPTEVDGFLADESEQAYEKVVERLLKSPRYGERMAVDWLDAARYADSNGYQVDRDRELWPWRDWVIRAFNDNKPFDQFTIEQIAGDLLPEATLEQRIATGFHRNHMMNEEGGIIPEEFLAEYTADRVETTAAVWLGQTFNCCRCHDHKFDPFTQRDFYALKAFFHNVPEKGVGIYSNPIRINSPPFLKLPAPEIEAKISQLNARMQTVNDQLEALAGESAAGLEEWARRVAAAAVVWEPVEILSASGGDAPPRVDAPTRTVEIGPQETRANTIKISARLPAGRVTALQLECATTAPAASFQWSELKVTARAAGNAQPSSALKMRAIAAGDSLAATETTKVLDNDRKTRVAISVTPERVAHAVFELEPALVIDAAPAEIEIELGVENANGPSHWRISTTATETELLVPADLAAIAGNEDAQRSAAERQQLAAFRLAQQPPHRALSDELTRLKKQLTAAEGEIPTTLVMEEMKEPRPTFVLLRGAYDKPGERVTAATPAVLPALADDQPRNRLGLARWLVSPQNPLTARVTVNRLWQQVFGTGLVKTSEDFGAQGEPPSHPELLDWLAGEFIRSGWDVKHMMQLMVTSATYRQQSRLTPLLRERDPENRLLARGPRFRLPAEGVRDQALAASGLLVEKIGGPSVRPYQPPGLYEQITAGSGATVYVPGKDDDLHRRSLYTYWKRSVPNPAMLLFDAPFRESCTLRRPRSNTPLQALDLMNDPTYVEAARFLAQRMMQEGGEAVDARLAHGFRLLLARPPRPAEMSVLRAAYERAHADFEKDVEAARALLTVGEAKTDAQLSPIELAAFTAVASTMLNLDEVITKE
jgi:Protein of unknown function (DUF1553)/Protein of unknown function (DUF1549)/Planctomycete cytochrome C